MIAYFTLKFNALHHCKQYDEFWFGFNAAPADDTNVDIHISVTLNNGLNIFLLIRSQNILIYRSVFGCRAFHDPIEPNNSFCIIITQFYQFINLIVVTITVVFRKCWVPRVRAILPSGRPLNWINLLLLPSPESQHSSLNLCLSIQIFFSRKTIFGET